MSKSSTICWQDRSELQEKPLLVSARAVEFYVLPTWDSESAVHEVMNGSGSRTSCTLTRIPACSCGAQRSTRPYLSVVLNTVYGLRDVFKDLSHCSTWHARILLALNPHKGTGNRHQRALELLGELDVVDTEVFIQFYFTPYQLLLNKPSSLLFIIHSKRDCKGLWRGQADQVPSANWAHFIHSSSFAFSIGRVKNLRLHCFCFENVEKLFFIFLQSIKF